MDEVLFYLKISANDQALRPLDSLFHVKWDSSGTDPFIP